MTARGTPLATVHALAEPTRMRIVELLREGPLSVGAIADRLGLRQPQTSKHLKVLAEGGIVDVTIDANRRIYALRPEPFLALDAWLQAFRPLMEERFDNLDTYLRALRDERSRDR
jgi:DNA-binding transcriptional ArsR family regulator